MITNIVRVEGSGPSVDEKKMRRYLAQRLWTTSTYLSPTCPDVGAAHGAVMVANQELIEILLGFEITEDGYVMDGGEE